MSGMSVGQLKGMTPEQREAAIKDLPDSTRLILAHLASLSIARQITLLDEYRQVLTDLTKDER